MSLVVEAIADSRLRLSPYSICPVLGANRAAERTPSRGADWAPERMGAITMIARHSTAARHSVAAATLRVARGVTVAASAADRSAGCRAGSTPRGSTWSDDP